MGFSTSRRGRLTSLDHRLWVIAHQAGECVPRRGAGTPLQRALKSLTISLSQAAVMPVSLYDILLQKHPPRSWAQGSTQQASMIAALLLSLSLRPYPPQPQGQGRRHILPLCACMTMNQSILAKVRRSQPPKLIHSPLPACRVAPPPRSPPNHSSLLP